jgi:hypothetical protein
MGELSKIIPQDSATVQAIYKWHEEEEAKRTGPHNGRLGASIIGEPCERKLWYIFRMCFKSVFDGRLLRLFRTGHLEEDRFIEELKGIGCEVKALDPDTGKQFENTAIGGHFVSHPDGYIKGLPEAPRTWHMAEMKTMGGEENQSKDFEKVKKDGVEKAKPMHYIQMQVNMFLSELKRAIYLCKKKATDHIHSERIKYVALVARQMMVKAERIITAQLPPERLADRPDTFTCRFCDAYDLCWSAEYSHVIKIPFITCRTCLHATPELDGEARWSCMTHLASIPFDHQQKACAGHLFIPALVHFAEVQDAGEDWVEYKNINDGAIWRNGNGDNGTWTSERLIKGEGMNDNIPFDVPSMKLPEKYSHKFTELVWDGASDAINDILPALGLGFFLECEPTKIEIVESEYIATEFLSEDGMADYLIVSYTCEDEAAIWKGSM